jgi:hypothetical protein
MRLRIVTILVILTAVAVSNTEAQVRQYAAKIVCGKAPNDALNFAPGTYFTTINVHNPAITAAVEFRKKFALAQVDEKPGNISQWFSTVLKADEAVQIDCRNIYAHLNIPPGTFIDGFAVIQLSTKQDLDVVGVYTAAGSTGVSTMHMERVAGRLTQ